MMRQVSAHQQFFDPARSAGLNQLLLAIGRAMSPPEVHMRTTFQPMRIIVVQPDLASNVDRAAEWGCETPQLLPLAVHSAQNSTRQRIIQGEILSDESGRLYEKLGRQVRPVHQLASGPAGELIEVIPADRNNLRVVPPSSAAIETPKVVTTQTFENHAETARHRKLFNEPGQWRIVTWGDFKEILASQLAHPDRLRDTYRLPCYVQVVETNCDVKIDELAAEFSTKDARPKPLYFLTDEIAARLELTSLLPPLPVRTTSARAANVLLAHERVFRLLVANDPTIDVGSFKKQEPRATSDLSSSKKEVTLKTSVPISFVKDWEFKISREEALYDLSDRSLFTGLRKFTRKLRVLKRRSEFRKWQVLIAGKSPDDQLWSVRPPESMLDHTIVREWVKKTLDLGGYDSNLMLREWEIFWRRKGFM